MTEPGPLLIEHRDGIAWLTLNRPARLNCVNRDLIARLADTLDDLAARDDLRVVVLRGAGRAFCTGQDLGERHADLQLGPPDLGAALDAGFHRIVRRIRALEVPVVAAVNGVAAGAGANLALACDIVIAARSARFIQSFVEVGLIQDTGGSWFLPRLVGMARARALALTGEPVDAGQAAAWGMIWRCVDDSELDAEVARLAASLAARPQHTLAAIKRTFEASADLDLDAQLDVERDAQRIAGRDPAYRAAVEVFVARRARHGENS